MDVDIMIDVRVRVPDNPMVLLRCLRGDHEDEECSLLDHFEVTDHSFDVVLN